MSEKSPRLNLNIIPQQIKRQRLGIRWVFGGSFTIKLFGIKLFQRKIKKSRT